jgi:hypothetical protein
VFSSHASEMMRSPVCLRLIGPEVKVVPEAVPAPLVEESTGLDVAMPDHSDTFASCMFVLAVIVTVTASLLVVHGELPLICWTLFQVVTPPPETVDTLMPPLPSSPTVSTRVSPLVGVVASVGATLVAGPDPAMACSTNAIAR